MSDKPKSRSARARKKLGIPEPVLAFKVWPEEEHRKFFFTVKIFKTRGQMRRYLAFLRPDLDHDDDWAFTDHRSLEMVFCLWAMGDGTVAHECFHAAAWWANRQFRSLQRCLLWEDPQHERTAEVCCELVGQIWERFCKAGFPRKECHGWPKTP